MKKEYISPELVIINFTLKDVVLSSPTDSMVTNEQDDKETPNNALDGTGL